MSLGGDSSLSSSLTDMMTSLMVIFVLLLVHYLKQSSDAQSEVQDRTLEIQEALRNNFGGELFKGIEVEKDKDDPLALIVIVPEDKLTFQPNSWDLTEENAVFLSSFVPNFLSVVCSEEYEKDVNSIVVEGHTDDTRPKGGLVNYNIELSQKRSFSVMDYIISHSASSERCFLSLASAAGKGESDLLYADEEKSTVDRRRSRRVQFKVRVKSLNQREFEKRV